MSRAALLRAASTNDHNFANRAGSGPGAAEGNAIFEHGLPDRNVPACALCHGDDAQGHDRLPRLAGQHADHLRKQVVVFQSPNSVRPAP